LEENAQQFATKETFIEETIRLTPNQLKTHVDQLPPSLKKIRTTTVEHNEEAIGIRLNAVRLSHPLSRLGMQRNDIILSVADTALGAAEALKTAETQSRLLAEQNTPIDVVLRRDDQTLLMRFVTEEPVLSWPDWMAVLNQPLADAIDALTLSKAPTPQEPITVTKQWLEAALDTPPGWLSALPLQPRTSNGVTIGLDASGIGEHFAAHHLGLEDADVVVELAGVHLASTEALSEAREAIRQAIATDTDIHLVVLLRTELPTAARFTIEVVNSEPLQPDCPVSKCWRAHPMDDEEPTAPTK
jgi:type II secretory pathway component PulC